MTTAELSDCPPEFVARGRQLLEDLLSCLDDLCLLALRFHDLERAVAFASPEHPPEEHQEEDRVHRSWTEACGTVAAWDVFEAIECHAADITGGSPNGKSTMPSVLRQRFAALLDAPDAPEARSLGDRVRELEGRLDAMTREVRTRRLVVVDHHGP